MKGSSVDLSTKAAGSQGTWTLHCTSKNGNRTSGCKSKLQPCHASLQTSEQCVFNRELSRASVVVLSLVFFILSAVPVGDARRSQPDPSAKRLHYDLMSPYNALVKPSAGPNHQLTVKMGMRLSQVLDVVSILL
ncbi:hypothetical protein BaRGS_00030336 [Batillaria attramentaria]|uniref:Uncharacterized protein n=1 Tax=Batillaria attramentaria TaxID=370345 RepID=A0ABD0JUD8_9CAEN